MTRESVKEIAKSGSGEETTERETTKAKAVEGGIIALATTTTTRNLLRIF
jgi:hypothetical protein